mgnify:CR=1 FL=1
MPPNDFGHPFSNLWKGVIKKIDLRFLSYSSTMGRFFSHFFLRSWYRTVTIDESDQMAITPRLERILPLRRGQTWRKFRKGNWRPNGQTQGYSNQGGPCIVWIFAPKITLNVVENKPIIMQIIWIFALKIIELVAGLALVCVKLGAWVTTCKAWQKSFADKRN